MSATIYRPTFGRQTAKQAPTREPVPGKRRIIAKVDEYEFDEVIPHDAGDVLVGKYDLDLADPYVIYCVRGGRIYLPEKNGRRFPVEIEVLVGTGAFYLGNITTGYAPGTRFSVQPDEFHSFIRVFSDTVFRKTYFKSLLPP